MIKGVCERFLTIVVGNPTLSKTLVSRYTTRAVNSAWQTTGTMIAPWTAPLMNRKTRGHLYTNGELEVSQSITTQEITAMLLIVQCY